MADINIRIPDCDDDQGERGKRGPRGHRGHRGHDGRDGATGPTGPTGPATLDTGALLKFSGRAAFDPEAPAISYLADTGFGFAVSPIITPPNYPVVVAHDARDMAANLVGFVVPDDGTVVVELLRDGVLVPGFVITYGPGEGGVKTIAAGPAAYAVGQVLDIRITTTGVDTSINVSAMIGVE